MKKSYRKSLTWLAFIVFGILVGGFAQSLISVFDNSSDLLPRNKYSLINPDLSGESIRRKYIPFELNTVKKIFENIELPNPEISLGVYVRNLDDNGPWFGIHENDVFSPIELLKMPLFIAYLKWSEENPTILEKTLSVPSFEEKKGMFLPQNILDENQQYSIKNLLIEMMTKSSEQATMALREEIDPLYLLRVHTELGIILPEKKNIEGFISLKEYSTFFRILYNADYLSPQSSEFALDLLTQTDFDEGISSGMSPAIVVANKFGERVYSNSDELVHQIHDCGIVYYLEYPYIICISAQGNDAKKLPAIIGQTAKIIQEEISLAYPQ
ncbi:serine hydrolase [Candidatus Gracilibacteria bacterium]|nr:serine hydrolase [Candidatus Gracilibacteria bacterium]